MTGRTKRRCLVCGGTKTRTVYTGGSYDHPPQSVFACDDCQMPTGRELSTEPQPLFSMPSPKGLPS